MVYFKYKKKLFMLLIFEIRPHWERYWLIYTVESRCLSSIVDIYICFFNKKRLGTSVLVCVCFVEVASTPIISARTPQY